MTIKSTSNKKPELGVYHIKYFDNIFAGFALDRLFAEKLNSLSFLADEDIGLDLFNPEKSNHNMHLTLGLFSFGFVLQETREINASGYIKLCKPWAIRQILRPVMIWILLF